MGVGLTAMLDVLIFNADHPFVYMIIEKKSGSALFVGRILELSEQGVRSSGFQSGDTYDPTYDPSSGGAVTVEMHVMLLMCALCILKTFLWN